MAIPRYDEAYQLPLYEIWTKGYKAQSCNSIDLGRNIHGCMFKGYSTPRLPCPFAPDTINAAAWHKGRRLRLEGKTCVPGN